MNSKIITSIFILITLLNFTQTKASEDLNSEIQKEVNRVYLISDPTERLREIKSYIKNEKDVTKKILFSKWAISYWLKLQRDERLKFEWKENLESFSFLYWVDWDTVKIIDKYWNKNSVRMIWIDTPESNTTRFWYKECYWEEAKDFLKNLIWDSKYINIEFDESQWKTDKYWRILWYLWLNWKNLNEELIKNWFAFEYTYNKAYKYQNDFKQAEKTADFWKKWMWNSETCNWERKKIDKVEIKNLEINSCWNKSYCSEMTSCEEARFYFNTCWLGKLDRDKDWIPCESLCGN